MNPATDNPDCPSGKPSAKRRHSPSENIKLGNAKKKRKVANPLLILVQAEVFGKKEDGREACLDDLEEQYDAILKQANKPQGLTRQDSDPTPTNDQEQTDLIQSAGSLSIGSLTFSRKSSFDYSRLSPKRNNSLNYIISC